MAQEFMRNLAAQNALAGLEVWSRGIFATERYSVPGKVKDFLLKNAIEYQGHTPVLISGDDMQRADLVLVMTAEQQDALTDRYAQHTDKIYLFLDYAYSLKEDMQDPINLQGRKFEKVAAKIKDATQQIFNKIK